MVVKAIRNKIGDEKLVKTLKVIMTLLFVCLPFLDILRGTRFKDIEIMNIAVIELINMIFVGISLVITFLRIDKKKFIYIMVYVVLVGVYILLHYKNIILFDYNIYPKASFSFLTESYYIFRVYLLPMFVLFILFTNRDVLDKKYYFTVIKWLIAFISFSIIILDLLKLSFLSYSSTHEHVAKSIFNYFGYEDNYAFLLARGWFDSANEISAIMFCLLPFNIYLLFKEHKRLNIALYAGQILAMIIVGTRTAALGSMLVSGFALALYVIMLIIKKVEYNNLFFGALAIVFTIMFIIFSFSPYTHYRNDMHRSLQTKMGEPISLIEIIDGDNKFELLRSNVYSSGVDPEIESYYPVELDFDFWNKVSKRTVVENNDSRTMKNDILGRIMEKNNNKGDKLFGLGYTLNFLDIERDYYYQYYLFGALGIILFIVPYVLMYAIFGFKYVFNMKKRFKYEDIILFMSTALILVAAYMSGHVFGWVSPMMILSLSLGALTYFMKEKDA